MQPLALFDLDDKLVDRRAAFHAWAEEFTDEHGLDDTALTFMITADVHHSGPMDSYFATICDTLDLAETPHQLWRQYRRRMPELAFCRAENLYALKRLRRAGWRIGIVTNGMTDNQLGKIRNAGLNTLVHAWAISGEVGICKPDPGIFRLAASRCGADPDHGGWMIGDDLALDIAGGHAAGRRPSGYNPNPALPVHRGR